MNSTRLTKLKNITQLAGKLAKCNLREFSFATRQQLPVVAVIGNNYCTSEWQESPASTTRFMAIEMRKYSSSKYGVLLTQMEEHGVVPDVVPCSPKACISVEYPTDVSLKEPGMVLTPTQVQDQPCVKWEADQKAFYTLCLTDPDAPSRKEPKFREWHHWLVGNIPGNKVEKGEVLAAYIGSGPPKDTGLHRYVFLVYKQQCKLKFDENRLPNDSADGRGGFKITKFAEKYKLGKPIAGNFYQAEYDEYVDCLYKKLGVV